MYWDKGSSNFLARCGEKQGTADVYGHCGCYVVKSIGQCSISTSWLLNLLENFNPYLCDVQKLVAQSNRREFFMICKIIGQTRLPLVAEFILLCRKIVLTLHMYQETEVASCDVLSGGFNRS